MTWTYSGNPSASTLDQVRYLCQDTDSTEQLLQDAEVTFEIAQNPNPYLAAAACAERLSLKFGRDVTFRVGDTQVNYGERAREYRLLATQLRQRYALRSAMPYAGGLSISEKQTILADTDRVEPAFHRQEPDDTPVWGNSE